MIQEKTMFEAIKPLIDSGIINEEAKTQLEEAWNSKLEEARAQIATDMRAEFANRYEHDKSVMVEALDKMVTESLTSEITKVAEEKAQLVEDRARFVSEMTTKASKFDTFMTENLTRELSEFAKDRGAQAAGLARLEKFVVRALAEELTEFTEDKKDLINTKVKLVAEAKDKLNDLRRQFIDRGSKLVETTVTNTIKAELGQLKEDIKVARENNFGRRLFEAYSAEFAATHLNEHAEIRSLKNKMGDIENKLVEATKSAIEKSALAESKDQEINKIKNGIARDIKLNEMLKPLAADKRAVMTSLLESVSVDKLESTFQKYLPAVVNGSSNKDRKVINESVVMTGDRAAKAQDSSDDKGNIVEIRRLAGLK
jgi:hypothetical protein